MCKSKLSTDHSSSILEACHTCRPRKVKLGNYSLPKIALASAPGSGNTWTRHLLQELSGIATGSIYCDKQLRDGEFPFECNTKRVLVVKTHEEKKVDSYVRAVVVVRNPIFSCFSYFHFLHGGHVGYATRKQFENDYKTFLPRCLRKWKAFHFKWLTNFTKPVHLVLYDDMKLHLQENLKGMAEFLHINYSDTDMCCTLRNQRGMFYREKSNITVESVLTADMLSYIEQAAGRVLTIIHKKFPKYSEFRFQSIKPGKIL
ncbi:hypothetical protein ScPMuIL_013620 [Solemya velum]